MHVRRAHIGVLAASLAAGVTLAAQQAANPTVPNLLAAAGKYLADYDRQFSAVVSEERYEQSATQVGSRSVQRRILLSDVMLMNADAAGWISLRDVFQVDGLPVRDHTDRLVKLMTEPAPDSYAQALRLAREGARFNVGSVERTINVPSTALLFLRTDNQKRSTFTFEGMKTVDRTRVAELDFKETGEPRIIRSPANAAAEGKFWLEPDSGRVIQTQFILKWTKDATAKITVHYANDPKIAMWVPVRMDEDYFLPTSSISGRADYRNFRKFAVDVATIIK